MSAAGSRPAGRTRDPRHRPREARLHTRIGALRAEVLTFAEICGGPRDQQWQALVSSFETYAHMLLEAVGDIADPATGRASDPWPADVGRPDATGYGPRSPDTTELTRAAGLLADELSELKRRFRDERPRWTRTPHSPFASPAAEWDVAADGLLGPDGVAAWLAGRAGMEWPDLSRARWDGGARTDRPVA
ncbi:hypothetical protein [Catenuloplanes atrovinosus]|uniref:Uncharacterized protein n=1 Tax=Catenuloplanes atrovinosus TaxID=137266 RepID=A0AAE3YSY6_9ACTN|nr:hypothetical protein [Catenuloplanes atrovinosus]MDR7277281.1 hypothetical protein [Catenuloplanes atrovinosus]